MDFIIKGLLEAIKLLINGDLQTLSAITATIKVSFGSMLISLIIGLPIGFVLGYYDFCGKHYTRILVNTFLSIPTVFIGLIVYSLLASQGPLGHLGLLFTLRGIMFGQALLAIPIVIALCASIVENVDEQLKHTLISLGASPFQVMISILWEVKNGVMAAALTAYGRVLTEVGISMMVGGNIKWYTRTITTAIVLETGKGMFSTGIALGLILILIAFTVNILTFFLRKNY